MALYTLDLLRLTAESARWPRLEAPTVTAERRAQPCGSRVAVDLILDASGKVSAVGLGISACAFGQASAALMANGVVGRSRAEIDAAARAVTKWLAREAPLPDWPGLDVLEPALPHTARHAAIRLPFEVAAAALTAREERAA